MHASPDNSSLVFSYTGNLTQWVFSCSMVSANVWPDHANYIVPVQAALQITTGTWLLSSAKYSVEFQLSGSVIVEQLTNSYPTTAEIVNVSAVVDGCAAGSGAVLSTFIVTFWNVSDGMVVGPRSISDLNVTNTIDCYGDVPVSLFFLGCSNNECNYQVQLMSSCRQLNINGLSFSTCDGNGTSSSLDGIHAFIVQPYTCQAGQSNSTCNTTASANPEIVSGVVTTPLYPTAFISTPNFLVDFAVLSAPSTGQHFIQRIYRRVQCYRFGSLLRS